jgi:hypothetical protein
VARTTTTAATTTSLVTDTSSVLWSITQGEQLEFNVTIGFISDLQDYRFEAVIVEADNTTAYKVRPTTLQPNGKKFRLKTRLHNVWDPTMPYAATELVRFGRVVYERLVSGTTIGLPNVDTVNWAVNTKRSVSEVFLKFPSTLSLDWTAKPTVDKNVYGFFELSVTEPISLFSRTWKPIRGMIEIAFSPTVLVNDNTAEGFYDNT